MSQILNTTTSLASGVKFWFGAMKDFQCDNVVFPDSVTTAAPGVL